MADSPTIVVARLDDKELQESITSMVTSFNKGLDDMKTHADSVVKSINESLKGIKGGSASSVGTSDGGSTKRARSQSAEAKAVDASTDSYSRQEAVMSQLMRTSERYTEEIKKQAQAIRESKEWQEKGRYTFADGTTILNLENEKKGRVDLEQQILDYQHKQAQAALVAAASEEKVEQAALRVAMAMHNVNAEAAESNKILRGKGGSNESLFQRYGDLRSSVAAVLSVEQSRVNIADIETASTKKLSASLKQLQEAYDNLSAADRNSHQGKELVFNIQQIQREIQKIKTQASRPISLDDVLNLPTNTLDEITYKMRQLQVYKGGLNLETQRKEMSEVNKAYDSLKRAQLSYMSDAQKMTGINEALGRSWNYMKNRLAFYLTVGAGVSFVKQLVDIRGQYELLDRSIGILIDSAQRGSQIFAELNAMAIKSPFTTMELGAAAKQLVAYDVAAKDVVDTTRRLADMAAAVGIPIERLTYALGQIKSYGYLNSRDARMFSNAGIPLVKQLADYYTELEGRMVSVGDVYDRIKKKTVDYSDVMQVVNHMTDEGGKFFNFQEKAADTLKVRIANLTLAWNNMLNEIGQDSQGFLSSGLGAAKELFENWRSINNMIAAAVTTFGAFKAIEISVLILTQKQITATRVLAILQKTLGASVATKLANLGSLFASMITPMQLANAAIGAFAFALIKATYDYYDLQKANAEFNKTIAKNADENINSINKFFDEYKKQLSSVGSLNNSDQIKLWERVQDEIEKTTKNAEEHIRTLNEISDVSARIAAGESVLEQSKVIEQEVKRLAELGTFNLGGGFGDDQLADNLIETTKYANELIKKYGTLSEAQSKLGKVSYANTFSSYKASLAETNAELGNFVSKLDNANIALVMGDGSVKQQLANIRAFSNEIRDNFLATERGQQISSDGQARLNKALDEWIAKQGVANGLITEEQAAIEANKTAWAKFFEQLNKQDKERLDYLIATNQTGSEEFKKIWDKAAKSMAQSATTSYDLIQQQIAELRSTPDIVLRVVYRTEQQKMTAQQRSYTDRYITPVSVDKKSADEYMAALKANREMYGRYMIKDDEDNVKWEKRLGEEYQNNAKSIESLNSQLKASAVLSEVDRKAKEEELKTLVSQQEVLDRIAKDQGFTYEKQKNKGGGSKKDPVLDALKTEIKLVEQLQGEYDKLTKSGASSDDALATIRGAFGNTIKQLNSQLRGYGLPELTTQLITGKDPNKALAHFKQTLQSLVDKGMMSLERSKEVEAIIEKLTISAKTYNLDKITKGLNSELDKLKEEYELAVELDANPELGSLFADWWDIDMEGLPHTAQAYAERATKLVNQYLKDENAGLELPLLTKITNDDLRSLREAVDADQFNAAWLEIIEKAVKASRDVRQKEASDQITDWDNLLQKYVEYEYKKTQIAKTAEEERRTLVERFGTDEQKERFAKIKTELDTEQDPEKKDALKSQLIELVDSIASSNDTALHIKTAIDTKELRSYADLDFTEFQKTGVWAIASGDLTGMTKTALKGLIDSLEEYKQKARNLDPKQIKQINRALKALHSEVRKDNPFSSIADTMEQASLRSEELQDDIDKTQLAIDKINAKYEEGAQKTKEDEEAIRKLNEQLQNLQGQQQALSKVSMKTVMDEVTKFTGAISGAASMVGDLAQAFGDTATAKAVQDIGTVIDKIGQGASLGGSVGGGWGALAGAIVGGAAGILQVMSDAITGNAKINDQIEDSERRVRRLGNAYKYVEYNVEKAIGTGKVGVRQWNVELKKLELAEVERQLRLEESRTSKNRDEDKIIELKGSLIDLRHEIEESTDEIVNDLLGISSVGDAVEDLVSSMIEAFKQGEDYMKEYDESFSEMIDNMIVKSISSKVVGDVLNKVWSELDKKTKERGEKYTKPLFQTGQGLTAAQEGIKQAQEAYLNWVKIWQDAKQVMDNSDYPQVVKDSAYEDMKVAEQKMVEYATMLEVFGAQLPTLQKMYETISAEQEEAMRLTPEDVQDVRDTAKNARDEAKRIFDEMMAAYGITFGQDAENQKLSLLQQGIQSVSEQTAGAIEGYLNGISQQSYLKSTLLTQIRDVIIGFDPEVSLGIQSQMLLQLQTQYQLMESMHSLMSSWTNPAGNGIRVEML